MIFEMRTILEFGHKVETENDRHEGYRINWILM
jgi:hypothetical protein